MLAKLFKIAVIVIAIYFILTMIVSGFALADIFFNDAEIICGPGCFYS